MNKPQKPDANMCRYILRLVRREFDVTLSEMKLKCRTARFIWPRQFYFYFAKEHTKEMTWQEIGDKLHQPHDYVIYSHKKISEKRNFDKRTHEIFDRIELAIKNN